MPVLTSAVYIMNVFILILTWQLFLVPDAENQLHPATEISSPDRFISVQADSIQLTETLVKDWIETRIADARLQKQMKGNAEDYEDVVTAYYDEREILLKSRGWTPEDYDIAEERIFAAVSAMDIADELEESREKHEKEIEGIKANEFLTEQQKHEMIKALSDVREQKRKQFVEPARPDWPAVKPWRSTLEQLTGWIAGNIPDPPIPE